MAPDHPQTTTAYSSFEINHHLLNSFPLDQSFLSRPTYAAMPSKRLVIFCDGTWCGRETGTFSNIRVVAEMVGDVLFTGNRDDEATKVHPIHAYQEHITAGYQEGVGLNKTFLEYLWDGGTASTIGEECVSVYKFIVDNYTDDHEIWMFGLSRGAFIVRCVAGMINNCGIIKKSHHETPLGDDEVYILSQEVYRTYRSPLDADKPKSPRCTALRNDTSRVWPERRPVRLMCILDTVGSSGIPRVNAGIGFDWPEFYDQRVSTVVKEVYHALALHDRIWIFQPCLAYNGPGDCEVKIHQTWFPGTHYDLGRQRFRFIRRSPNAVERMIGAIPDLFSKTIYPNEVLADVVLRWMLQAIQATEATDRRSTSLIPDLATCRLPALTMAIAKPTHSEQPTGPTGSGDVYGNILEYGPAGGIFSPIMRVGAKLTSFLNGFVPRLGYDIQDVLGIKVILRILTATRDRRIPAGSQINKPGAGDKEPDVYPYKSLECARTDQGVEITYMVDENARVSRAYGGSRYPSRTYETFNLWRSVFGV